MKKLKVSVSVGLQGCQIDGEIEVDEGLTEDAVDAEVREWALQHVDWWIVKK